MARRLKTFLLRIHWPILLAAGSLMAVGISAIYVSEQAEGASGRLSMKQTIYACMGVVVFLVASRMPYQRVGRLAYPLFAGTLALLVLVLFLPPIRRAHRWIDLKIILLQPSEIAKLTYIILLAWYLRYGGHYRRLRGLVIPFVLTLLPMGLILIEPDLGTSLLLMPTLYIMLFMAGAKLRHLLGVVAVVTAVILLPAPRRISEMGTVEANDRKALAYRWSGRAWTFDAAGGKYLVAPALLSSMKHHQLRRIEGWLRQNDPAVARTKGYQLYQSKLILATGQWSGRGGWTDADAYFHLLPDDHTDFIFSVIGGQWGLLGCLVLLGLYGVIVAAGVRIAMGTDEPFGRLLAIGVVALLFSQICINVGMTIGLMPITGMTLPLVSYGGSSLIVNCAALGLLASVGGHRPILLARRPFEYGPRKEKVPPISRPEAIAPRGSRRGQGPVNPSEHRNKPSK